jgi:hypothetical protein
MDRTIRYATAIRAADPDALIAGPAEWGWIGYLYSGRDRMAGVAARPDRRAHGDTPLIAWYLQQIASHEKSSGQRLLDVLDVHFYPAAEGLYGPKARTDAEGAALRLRSTRALWDPSYKDESWIGEPIRLIPRLKQWVQANHPGLAISLGEWSFGADEHISGGLATAEALGRFGQQGLDRAFYWGGPKLDTATFWAFRAFRNFDGAGGHFEDVSLDTSEDETVSLFASRDEKSTHLVAVLVNRDPVSEALAHIDLNGCGRPRSQRVFSYVSGARALAPQQAGTADARSISETVPAYSFMVVDVPLDAAPQP